MRRLAILAGDGSRILQLRVTGSFRGDLASEDFWSVRGESNDKIQVLLSNQPISRFKKPHGEICKELLTMVVLFCITDAHSSTVVVYLSATHAVIASDSLINRIEGVPPRQGCKIAQVRRNMFFAATGTGVFEDPPFDPYQLALEIATTKHTPAEAAKEYGSRARSTLQNIWNAARPRYLEVARQNGLSAPTGPQDYIFVGLDAANNLSAAGASFVEVDQIAKILRLDRFFELHSQRSSEVFLIKYGVFQKVPDDAQLERLIQQVGSAEALKHAIEVQISATPLVVGPPVTVVVIRRDGSFVWYSRGNCK